MFHDYKVGQKIRIWPRPGLRVLVDPRIPGRFLPAEGTDVAWSPWWQRRASDGSVVLTNPTPAPAAQPKPAVSK